MKKWILFWLAAIVLLIIAPAHSAQPLGKMPRLGALLYSNPGTDPNFEAFRDGLRQLGYIEGKNLLIDHRFADQKPERLAGLAAELVRSRPDVIFALGGDVVPFAQKATKTIPIVMWVSNDPVEMGFVASLSRPGGNLTGVTLILDELAGKRLALLREVMPQISRVAILWNPEHADPEFREIQAQARALGVQLQSFEVRRGADFEPQLRNVTNSRAEAVVVVSSRLMQAHRQIVLEFAAKNRLPVIGDWGRWAPDGAVLSYGPNIAEMIRRSAIYVDKILKGSKPAELPVERPTKFELVINLKTAKQIGLTVPPQVLAKADRVIR